MKRLVYFQGKEIIYVRPLSCLNGLSFNRATMIEVTSDRLQIAYKGPAVEDGKMSMLALGSSLRGQALLIERVKDMLYGNSISIKVELDYRFEHGSLLVPVYILSDALTAKHALSGETATALANLITFLGFGGGAGVTLYKLFKRLKGRRIEKPEDISDDLKLETLLRLLIQIYNDPEVQKQLRKTLEALHHEGIEEFQTLRQGQVIESVTKTDLLDAEQAEIEDLTKDEEVELDIEKCAWRKSLAWHFSDGRISFDAKIEDKTFWARIDRGEAFAGGDRLRVHLRTTAHRTPFGKLKVERVIPTVLSVDHIRNGQTEMFDNNEEAS